MTSTTEKPTRKPRARNRSIRVNLTESCRVALDRLIEWQQVESGLPISEHDMITALIMLAHKASRGENCKGCGARIVELNKSPNEWLCCKCERAGKTGTEEKT